MKLDRAGARARDRADSATALGTSMAEAARGIYRVVAESMAAAARAHATDRGVDYRGLPLFAFGGAGPVHACDVAELLQSPVVIFPPQPSVLSAFGTLVTPLRLDLVRSALVRLRRLDWARVDAHARRARRARRPPALAEAGCKRSRASRCSFGADMRYFGQQNEVTVCVRRRSARRAGPGRRARSVRGGLRKLYGVRLPDMCRRDRELAADRARGPLRRASPCRELALGAGRARRPTRACTLRWHRQPTRRSTIAARSPRGQTHQRPGDHRGARDHHRHSARLDARRCDATGCIMAAKE